MSIRLKLSLAAILVGAAIIGSRAAPQAPIPLPGEVDGLTLAGFLILGELNLFVRLRSGWFVRGATYVVVLAGLLSPRTMAPLLLLLWIVWPIAIMVAVGLDERTDLDEAMASRTVVAALVAASVLGAVSYRLILRHDLGQTSVLFIGIPALLAIVVVYFVSPRSATGVACKAVTIGLLISLVFLWEGALCVAMAAPLFYIVAIGIGSIADAGKRNRTTIVSSLLLAVAPMSLEGVTPATTINRAQVSSATKIVAASPDAIGCALFGSPRFDRALPGYLRAGFPRAVQTHIDRTGDRPRWIVNVSGGEMYINGMEHRSGELVLSLEEARPGHVRWRAVSDTSHMRHFLTWREIAVDWHAVDGHRSQVTWTIHYDRGLDPAWYFGPWEQYAVGLAAGYLIDTVATP